MNDMSQIMKQAKAMQEKMAEMQKKLEDAEIEGISGGGAIKVIMSGKHDLKKIDIDPTLIKADEKEVLEDLIIAAINDATTKISEHMNNFFANYISNKIYTCTGKEEDPRAGAMHSITQTRQRPKTSAAKWQRQGFYMFLRPGILVPKLKILTPNI